jgi:hypothetical protein
MVLSTYADKTIYMMTSQRDYIIFSCFNAVLIERCQRYDLYFNLSRYSSQTSTGGIFIPELNELIRRYYMAYEDKRSHQIRRH